MFQTVGDNKGVYFDTGYQLSAPPASQLRAKSRTSFSWPVVGIRSLQANKSVKLGQLGTWTDLDISQRHWKPSSPPAEASQGTQPHPILLHEGKFSKIKKNLAVAKEV